MAKSMRITLVALFFFWMCKKDVLADEMSFETFLAAAIAAILLRLPWGGFYLVRKITDLQIIRPNLLNFRSREQPICTKICTKASAFVLLAFCFGSALVS